MQLSLRSWPEHRGHFLPIDDHAGLSVFTSPTPPSYTPSRVSWRFGEIVTLASIAQSATATVLLR